METGDLTGRVALVTGSTSGIGIRIVEALLDRGARVCVNGRNPDAGAAALKRLSTAGGDVIFEQGDAGHYDEITRVIESAEEHLGPIDILVCSGGRELPGPTPFADLKPEDILGTFETRYLPRVYPVHALLPRLRERERGSIVFIGTDAGRHATPGEAVIGSWGAAMIMLTKGLAREFARWKIRVNCVALTLTSDTIRYGEVFAEPGFQKNLFTKALAKFPFGAPPSASEVASVVAFLASDEAAQVTGQTISVNGGLSFGGW